MPFAPAMRAEDAEHFLVDLTPKTADAAKFMTITYDVTEQCKREAPATVHIDGTARPQLIHRTDNPDYYDIFTEYNRLTGLSILVNTSFNMHEEPIVCSPADAIRAFLDSNIDFLALGPFLLAAPQKH
jgi:carbamoyltransferase